MFVTRFCLTLLLLVTFVRTVNAGLVFSAPPRETPEAGNKISSAMQGKIIQAPLSAKSKNAIAVFRKRYVKKDELASARDREYIGMYAFLKDIWGFGV